MLRYLFFSRSTASARCFPTGRAAFSRLEPAQGLSVAISSGSALFLNRGWLSKSAPASVVIFIYNGFNSPFCPLAFPQKGHVSSPTNCTLLSRRGRASAWWSTRLRVREFHPVFVQDMAWRRVVACRNHCHDISHQQVPPRHATPGSCLRSLHREPSIVSSCETPRHSANTMAPFSCALPNLAIALFIVVLSRIWRSCRSFSQGARGGRVRALIGHGLHSDAHSSSPPSGLAQLNLSPCMCVYLLNCT